MARTWLVAIFPLLEAVKVSLCVAWRVVCGLWGGGWSILGNYLPADCSCPSPSVLRAAVPPACAMSYVCMCPCVVVSPCPLSPVSCPLSPSPRQTSTLGPCCLTPIRLAPRGPAWQGRVLRKVTRALHPPSPSLSPGLAALIHQAAFPGGVVLCCSVSSLSQPLAQVHHAVPRPMRAQHTAAAAPRVSTALTLYMSGGCA